MSWIGETIETIKILRKPENLPVLPVYPMIQVDDIPAASALVFYGLPGNALSERICAWKYGCPFHPSFHAALMMRDGVFHNVGKFRTDELLSDEFKSERRIDVIIYKTMTEEARKEIMRATELDTSEPHTGLEFTDYGVQSFIHFGFRFVKSGKAVICSEDVVKLLNVGLVWSSTETAKETAPFELSTFAMKHPELCEIRTVHVGQDFAKKASLLETYKYA
jgi:hypothetical protein